MGKLKVFSVFDKKVEVYGRPWQSQTVGLAIRSFGDAVNDDQSGMKKHPEDYDLFLLGDYDEELGRFENLDTPQHMARAIDHHKSYQETAR